MSYRVVIVEAEDTADPRDVRGAAGSAAAPAAGHRKKALPPRPARRIALPVAAASHSQPALSLAQVLAAAIRAGDVGRVSELLLSLPPPPPLAFGLLQASSFGNRDM